MPSSNLQVAARFAIKPIPLFYRSKDSRRLNDNFPSSFSPGENTCLPGLCSIGFFPDVAVLLTPVVLPIILRNEHSCNKILLASFPASGFDVLRR